MKNRQCFPKSLLLRWEEYPHGGVRSAAVAGELISLLCSLPKLKKLNIGICSQYMESVRQGIEEAQLKLPQVYILHMDRFSDTFLDMCPNVKTLSTRRLVRDKFQRVFNARNESVSNIENLILDGRYYVDCSFLDDVAIAMPRLKTLHIGMDAHDIFEDIFVSIISKFTDLRSLSLPQLEFVSSYQHQNSTGLKDFFDYPAWFNEAAALLVKRLEASCATLKDIWFGKGLCARLIQNCNSGMATIV